MGEESPKIFSLSWCKKGTNLYGPANYTFFSLTTASSGVQETLNEDFES